MIKYTPCDVCCRFDHGASAYHHFEELHAAWEANAKALPLIQAVKQCLKQAAKVSCAACQRAITCMEKEQKTVCLILSTLTAIVPTK